MASHDEDPDMVLSRETEVYRRDANAQGTLLTPAEREKLLKPYLPSTPRRPGSASTSTGQPRKARPIRNFLKNQLHLFLYFAIHTVFSIYVRIRQVYHAILARALAILYHHHRTPALIRKDTRGLTRLPQHLSIILESPPNDHSRAALDALLDDVAEIAAWCACVGIPLLSIYEKSGVLKNHIPRTHRKVAETFHAYFGRQRPSLQVRAPNTSAYLNGDVSPSASPAPSSDDTSTGHLTLLLLSSTDARPTLVDLTKTLVEMAQQHKLTPSDITIPLLDTELSESVMPEPDLLILFGPNVKLQGYPPWQLRLTEIFHVQDGGGVEYLVWLKGLHRYAKAEMRFGR